MRWLRYLLWFATSACLLGCASQDVATETPQPPRSLADQYGPELSPQPLSRSVTPLEPYLDLGILLFDPGVSDMDRSPQGAVRRLESKLLARELRQVLVDSGEWGAVRILPEASYLTPVMIEAAIDYSDGRDLVVSVSASDALNRVWFEETLRYRAHAAAVDAGAGASSADFAPLFTHIHNALHQYWSQQTSSDRLAVIRAADIRYAQELAPEAFAGFLVEEAGQMRLARLPAANDPMLARVDRIRRQDYLFCDTIDEQFVALYEEVGPTYALWRLSSAEQADWLEHYEARVAAREAPSDAARFATMQAQYSAYRSFRMQEQELYELADAFDGEVEPRVLEADERVFTLTGTLTSQYAQWREILAQIFRLEQEPGAL